MNVGSIPTEVADNIEGLDAQMYPLIEKQFAGLAYGTHYLRDEEFVRYFDMETQKRPNLLQMLALQGAEGRKEIRRYGKALGTPEMAEFVIRMYAKEGDDGTDV